MTLVEIMVVVAIIGLVMSAVALQVHKRWIEAQRQATKTEIATTKTALMSYATEHGEGCPESLEALVADGILEDEPLDAWGQPLLFRCPAQRGRGIADIWSTGRDGIDGTEDDIGSWDLRRRRHARR